MGVCHFGSFYAAVDAAQHLVELGPVSLELVDKTMIALAVFRRYSGAKRGATLRVANALLGPDETEWSRRLGSALRLAETFTGGNTALLKGAELKLDSAQLVLTLGPGQADLFGDLVRTRFGALAKQFGVSGVIEGEGLREVVG